MVLSNALGVMSLLGSTATAASSIAIDPATTAVGVDAMATFTLRHVYARVGAGTAIGMPASPNVNDTRPMIGGLLGAGLVGRLESVEGPPPPG